MEVICSRASTVKSARRSRSPNKYDTSSSAGVMVEGAGTANTDSSRGRSGATWLEAPAGAGFNGRGLFETRFTLRYAWGDVSPLVLAGARHACWKRDQGR